MKQISLLLCVTIVLLLCGCGDETETANSNNPPPPIQNGSVTIEYEIRPSILFEAEDGEVVNAPVTVFEDVECSRGEYVMAPEGEEHKELSIGGDVTYAFSVKEAGKYRLWLRTRFCCACGNSLGISLDGNKVGKVEDAVFEKWHWEQLRLRMLELAAGAHTLTIANREDGAAWDQILLTQDRDYRPAGMEDPDVEGRTTRAGGLIALPEPEPPVAVDQ